MAGGPTTGAGEAAPNVWAARPALALLVRVLTVLVPFGTAIGVAVLVGPVLLRPSGTWGMVFWIAQVSVLSTSAVLVVDRLARRSLPLASLYNLSLVFPDEAPSRFSVALKSGSTRRLQHELANRPDVESTHEAATRLLAMVSALNDHDRLTRGHTERVRAYSDLIAAQMNSADVDRWRLRWAVLLHDIGKLTVPPEILNKSGRPTEEEWAVLSGHPAAGALMVEPLADWLGEWRLAAGEHHERWDGKGYPNGLAGEEISLAGRIVAVADAYDVITSARSYKKPMTAQVAREELVRCAGSQFDPQVVRAFVNVSLGRLRLAGGPMAWLASLPRLGSLPEVAAGVLGNLVAVVSAAALIFAVGIASSPDGSRTGPIRSVAGSIHRGPSTTSTSTRSGASSSSTSMGGPVPTTTAAATDPGVTTTTSPAIATSTTRAAGAPRRGRGVTTTSAAPTSTSSVGTTAPAGSTATTSTTTTGSVSPTTTVATVGPTAVHDVYSALSGGQINLAVLANDWPGGAPLDVSTLVITAPPTHAALGAVLSDGSIAYTSQPGYSGVDTFSYRVCNGLGLCASTTVTITVI